MKIRPNNLHREVFHKAQQNKHLLMGYLFLSLVFVGAVSSVYYWENKTKVTSALNAPIGHVGSGEQETKNQNGMVCAQVITYAKQKNTGEIRQFPSPCHVTDDNWQIIK
jgi:hypothetical protein